MGGLYLPVIHGTQRKDNYSRRVARFVHARGAARPGVETRLFEPSELPFGNLLQREWEMEPRPAPVAAFVAEMGRADGFVLVTPEYNHGIPGTLKNVLDHLYDEWGRKPFAVVGVSNGQVGGARAVEQLRMVIPGLNAVSVPYSVLVRDVESTFPGDSPSPADEKEFTSRVERLWKDLEWYAQALKAARAATPK